jgi:hypothetical protein
MNLRRHLGILDNFYFFWKIMEKIAEKLGHKKIWKKCCLFLDFEN